MFVYKIKVFINKECKEKFVDYLQKTHMAEVVNTGCFLGYTLESDAQKNEILVSYRCDSREMFDKYLAEHADIMRKGTMQKFSESIIKIEREFVAI